MEDLVIKKTPLKDKLHKIKPGSIISNDALELMQDQLDCLTEVLIKLAIDETEKQGRKKIIENDVEKAFKKLIRNAESIDDTITKLKDTVAKLEYIKENSVSRYIDEV